MLTTNNLEKKNTTKIKMKQFTFAVLILTIGVNIQAAPQFNGGVPQFGGGVPQFGGGLANSAPNPLSPFLNAINGFTQPLGNVLNGLLGGQSGLFPQPNLSNQLPQQQNLPNLPQQAAGPQAQLPAAPQVPKP